LPRKPHRFIGTLEKLKQRLTLLPIGKIKVIQGDSRKLSELLSNSQTDIIITSPPYVNATLKKEFKSEEELDKFVKGQKWLLEHGRSEEGIKRFIKKSWTGYPDSPDNIGNLPIGDVDTIITSPPYGERRNYQDIERSKANIDKYFSKKNINPDLYAEDPANINRLEYKEDIDAIITSPPYAESLYHLRNKPKEFWEELSKRTGRKAWLDPNSKTRKTQSEKDEGYGKDKENIGNLPLGNVDAIITSPPYGESMTKKRKGYTIFPQLAKTREMPQDTKDENIANLPHGDIDAIITSPPYEGSILSGGDPARRKERLLKAGHNPEDFLGGKARNAVLKHYDEVDAIITSPPYAESLSVTSGGRKGRWDKDGTTKKKKLPTTYSDNSNNIGNMPLGNVDAIITSPPYAESMQERGGTQHKFEKEKKIGVHYSHDKTNIGNLPLGKIDVAITSPPYEGSMEGGSRHTGGIIERTKDSNSDTTVKGGLGVKYSENSNNIGNMKKETYLEAMLKVYSECYKVLKDGGLMIVVVKAFYRNKKVVDLPYQTLLLLQKAGFQFEDVLKLKLDRLSFWRILQFKKNPNIPRVVHEHIIIVRKGDVN
jgi:DNA modification methylase